MGAGLIVAAVLVAANAFFVCAEFSITRLRPTQVGELLRQRRPGAASVAHAVERIDAYLSACQLGITLASLGLGAVGESALHDLLEPALGDSAQVLGVGLATLIAFTTITVAHVTLGELAPKSGAISRTVPLALIVCPPMRVFYLATRPLVDAMNFLGNLVLKPFGIPPASEAGHAPHTEGELRELLRESSEGGTIGAEERRLSDAALVFGDLRVREVMQPRGGIDVVTTADTREQLLRHATRSGHTRLPIIEPATGLEEAIGVLNVKDLLGDWDGTSEEMLRRLARPLPRVAEGVRVDAVLRGMRRARRHMALVVDELGTVTGLVTLEDVIEELVGEIDDEFDPEHERLVWRSGDRLHLRGIAPLRVAERELGRSLEDAGHEATVGGLVVEVLGRVPAEGETVVVDDGLAFEVVKRDETRVEEVAVVSDGG